ncbi:hypothetical protein B5E80_06555 [Flavonifractor sp. An135]|nr:M56 family metallopeptidase [Flavonifractor sp. An135]OUQ24757.1 hypothetical protein B5E80_06555 [Flavonifractor sp. An135]
MKDILITSSVLIAALLILRFCFRSRIPRRFQYALWGLVLIRLLVPVELPALPFSVLNAGTEVQQAVSQTMARPVYLPIQPQTDRKPSAGAPVLNHAPETAVTTDVQSNTPAPAQNHSIPLSQVLGWIWAAGMAVMALYFLGCNLHFWYQLRRRRTPFPLEHQRRPVYLCPSLASPCLFGLFRPSIYLTPEAAADPDRLRHVLIHEETHARHLDPLWSLLRCVCLTIYWFDPLVWAAAICSRIDCELACDEGALHRLGDGERFAYGQTLLSLIPVERTPANPLLTATTMAAGKRQLKDRVQRIARRPKWAAPAILSAALLAAVVSACTFAAPQPTHSSEDTPLTGEELAFFNEQFFNNAYNTGINMHNQFLCCSYEKPEDIDLFELFYNGDGNDRTAPEGVDQEALDAALDMKNQACPATILTVAQMDAVLTANTGLTLEDMNQVGFDHFQYLADFDLYYHFHGDTNYRGNVIISAGTRNGNLVSLYYEDSFFGDGWKCVTLEEMEDGTWQFRSNVAAEQPTIPTAVPDWEPTLTIPLEDLEPYQAPTVTVERHTNDCAERLGGYQTSDHTIRPYRSTDGNIYAAVVDVESTDGTWDARCFVTFPDSESWSISFFSDLFGQEGLVISYFGEMEPGYSTTIQDYYTFAEDGTPSILARVYFEGQILDLDGDGENELASPYQFFYQRDGKLYEANLKELLTDHWPELEYWDYSSLDPNTKAVSLSGLMTVEGWGEQLASCDRDIYFNGENILVYRDERPTENHILGTIDVPEEVLQEALAMGEARYESAQDGDLDDWRVSAVEKVPLSYYGWSWDGPEVEVYRVVCEFHSADPANMVLAGGAYMDENGWAGGILYGQSNFLVCTLDENGERTFLESLIPLDCDVGGTVFFDYLTETLAKAA